MDQMTHAGVETPESVDETATSQQSSPEEPTVVGHGVGTSTAASRSAQSGRTPQLLRVSEGRLFAGVAAGLAQHLGFPVIAVRLVFIALAWFGGLGALLYAAFWAVLPLSGPDRPVQAKRDGGQLVAFAALAIGVQLVQLMNGGGGAQNAFGWLVAVVAVGAGIIWHQADPVRRRELADAMPLPWLARLVGDDYRGALGLRLAAGGALVLVGIIGLIVVLAPLTDATLASILVGLLFTSIAVGGLAVVIGPLVWKMVTELRAERVARIREQERAEIAAMVHDQVLHTLALIQRNASDTRLVQRLARSQERSLRNWLYKPTASPAERFTAALEQVAAEIEDAFALTVDTVMVGDCEVDERVGALVAAAREALVNAGKHAKVSSISLYAEVEPDQVSVFVRDRGVGFDPNHINSDRHGVRGSIIGRMERHGGTAQIRSAPGEGTEVRLILPVKRPATSHA